MTKTRIVASESEVTLQLLKAINEDSALTQRSAAHQLGIALGLVNTYLKRCAKKGLIKMKQVPSNRYAYYLTPKGFAEKSRLTAEFLSQSLNLFRQAQGDFHDLLDICVERNWRTVALHGLSDLAEIFVLYARDYPVGVAGIVDAASGQEAPAGIPLFASEDDLTAVDGHILTCLNDPQANYDRLCARVGAGAVLVPALLEVNAIGGGGRRQ